MQCLKPPHAVEEFAELRTLMGGDQYFPMERRPLRRLARRGGGLSNPLASASSNHKADTEAGRGARGSNCQRALRAPLAAFIAWMIGSERKKRDRRSTAGTCSTQFPAGLDGRPLRARLLPFLGD